MVFEGGAGLAARADRINPPRQAPIATMRPATIHMRPVAIHRSRREILPFSVDFIWLTSPWLRCNYGVSQNPFGATTRKYNDSKGAAGIGHAFNRMRAEQVVKATSTCGQRPGIYHSA